MFFITKKGNKRNTLKTYNNLEEIQIVDLKTEITQNINELDPLLEECNDKFLKYHLRRAAELEIFFGDGTGELTLDRGSYGQG